LSEFTPGPWKVDGVDEVYGPRVASDSGLPIAALNDWEDAESSANLHLILAAPDLYEALTGLLDAPLYEGGHPLTRLSERHIQATESARAALAKARGEMTG
jgi:hypothetical protein